MWNGGLTVITDGNAGHGPCAQQAVTVFIMNINTLEGINDSSLKKVQTKTNLNKINIP